MSPAAMTLVARWWKFNLVGVVGFVVQMGALVLLRRICGSHYLLATAIALELTLAHNFLWHLRFTWRDRCAESRLSQFARFQLSNGLVSLAGNLGGVRLLVRYTHVPLLAANAITVLLCAVANFYAGNVWAFAHPRNEASPRTKLDAELVGPPGLEPGTNGL